MSVSRFCLSYLIGLSAVMVGCAQRPVKIPAVDPKWVEEVAREHNHEVLKCYEAALKVDKSLQGDLVMEVDAGDQGSAVAVRLVQGLSAGFNDCVVAKAKLWKYPWIKEPMLSIQENYRLNLNDSGQPVSSYLGPRMDRKQVQLIVQTHTNEIEQCYAKTLRSRPNTEGTLEISWDIFEAGEVTNIKVVKPLEPNLDKCIVKSLAKWRFPPPPNKIVSRVSYPFEFTKKAKN